MLKVPQISKYSQLQFRPAEMMCNNASPIMQQILKPNIPSDTTCPVHLLPVGF
jgi:hypothetical protein